MSGVKDQLLWCPLDIFHSLYGSLLLLTIFLMWTYTHIIWIFVPFFWLYSPMALLVVYIPWTLPLYLCILMFQVVDTHGTVFYISSSILLIIIFCIFSFIFPIILFTFTLWKHLTFMAQCLTHLCFHIFCHVLFFTHCIFFTLLSHVLSSQLVWLLSLPHIRCST